MRIRMLSVMFAFVFAAPLVAAGFLSVGDAAPSFELMSDEGKPTKLSDYRGKWVVLYFYPKDFTSGCTMQAQNFQKDLAKYAERNAEIVGVSVDTPDSHKSFCEKEGLKFRLLSDTDASVSTAYNSVMEYQGSKLSARNTFIIDPEGKVARVFPSVKPAGHSAEVLAALDELAKGK
jgi:thioredoxin-dependent peroxiredoxin